MFIALRDAPRGGQDSARQYGKNTDKDGIERNTAAADLHLAAQPKNCDEAVQQEAVTHG